MNFAAAKEINKEMKQGNVTSGGQNFSSSNHSYIYMYLHFRYAVSAVNILSVDSWLASSHDTWIKLLIDWSTLNLHLKKKKKKKRYGKEEKETT